MSGKSALSADEAQLISSALVLAANNALALVRQDLMPPLHMEVGARELSIAAEALASVIDGRFGNAEDTQARAQFLMTVAVELQDRVRES